MSEIFHLSQSLLKDYESMCPIAFSKKHFGTEQERLIFQLKESEAMRWGIYFETLVVGSGMGGKTIELTSTEKKSAFYKRVVEQAKLCRAYLKAMDGKMVGSQELLQASYEWQGQTIYIQGNLDIRWQYSMAQNAVKGAVIDLKSTGDLESTFGKFQWGNIDKIDVTQMIHYGLLYQLNFGEWPDTFYLVFDISNKERFTPFQVQISEWTIEDHKERAAKAYNQITESLMLDYWEPQPRFSECKSCPIRDVCKYAQRFPEIEIIQR